MKRTVGTVGVVGVMMSMTLIAAAPSAAAPGQSGCDSRTNNTQQKLLECVRVDGVVEHLEAFQAIADANGGTRADQTPGYEASVDYVVEVLEAAGWSADVVPFTYDAADVILRQLTPVDQTYLAYDAVGSGEDDVTGTVIPVDLNLTDDRSNSSGCEPGDFVGDWSGTTDIALIQRGSCPFTQKVQNAEAAGAEAVVLFNQGDSVGMGDRFGPVSPTLAPYEASIPVVGTSFDAGVALAAPGSTANVTVDYYEVTSENVIGELAGKNATNVVMAGAHLDSVPEGPGINDNGSGSAALLEVAQQMAKSKPQNTVRFAWWGAEELGLIGSTEWVAQQQELGELDKIALYLNFDMIGSPNYYFGIYDANQSSFVAPVVVPEGSTDIERTFESFYTLLGEPYDDSAFSGRSDYSAFIDAGIPSGGLFTGAEEVKTAEQEALWGGEAGQWFDPCYHQACDTIDNVNMDALEVNSDAVAFAVSTYAASTESVNGVVGAKIPGNFQTPEPAGPEHTFAGPLGGDDHGHDHDRLYDSE
jgi:Zn-dependent M28 family amino/carboxypeptidase